jgi:hypothetical protein
MLHFVVTERGSFTIRKYLAGEGSVLAERMRVVLYKELAQMERLPLGTWVFTEPDQLDVPHRELARHVRERLHAAGARVMNDPTRVLLRGDLLRAANDAGVNDHRAWLASDVVMNSRSAGGRNANTVSADALRYPVFVRYANEHAGNLTPLLDSPRALSNALGELGAGGTKRHDLLVVEFCDTKDENGLYRKYAAYKVGDVVLPRSVECATEWMVKWHGRIFDRERAEDEIRYCETNPHGEWIAAMFRMANIDYGRIDYSVQNGTPRLWEINTNPTLPGGTRDRGPRPPAVDEYRAMVKSTRAVFHSRFQAAWAGVDTDAGEASIEMNLPPSLARSIERSDKRRRHVEKIDALVNAVIRQRWGRPLSHGVKRAIAAILATRMRAGTRSHGVERHTQVDTATRH